MSYFVSRALTIVILAFSGASACAMEGPIDASVVRVIDGDTLEADAHVWPGHTVRVSIRLRGIDAPEIRTRCDREKAAGLNARSALEGLVVSGRVRVRNIGADKYYGRVVADVETPDGIDLARALLAARYARPYEGGRRVSLCD